VHATLGNERPTRWFAAFCLVGGVIALIVAFDYGGYPFALHRFWILEYLLRTQDVTGGALGLVLVLAACVRPLQPPALRLVDAMAAYPWRTAALTFAVLCLGAVFIEQAHPLAQDEYAALFQSKVFAAGRLTGEFPPSLLGRLIPPFYVNQFLFASFQTGGVASAYWPGFALLLAPFTALHAPWACNPLLASVALVLIGRLAERLTGEPRARGWAMLFAVASPQFTAMALTYFSMTAHLLLNLAFVSLIIERTAAKLWLAGLVGSFALVLHNPVPHTLFAAPWIVWLLMQPQRYRNVLLLAAGYAPLALAIGFGWALLLSHIQGNSLIGFYPVDDDPFHQVANFFWGWYVKMRTALPGPRDRVAAARFAELARLWAWAVPGLPLLALAGAWLARRNVRVALLALSFVTTVCGYFLVGFTQGHGWGARYLHPAWGVLPVLAAVALTLLPVATGQAQTLWRYVAGLAVLSLVLASALRATQIHAYVELHLASRPPLLPDVRQVVFIAFDRHDYAQDLVQNDPFLRSRVWYMASRGPRLDEDLMRRRFPAARRVSLDERGSVWFLQP
jgi:hypothetical protein